MRGMTLSEGENDELKWKEGKEVVTYGLLKLEYNNEGAVR